MKTHGASRFVPVLLAVLAAGASAAAAQEPDDFSFAKRLAYRGWFDLAEHVCARIERDHSLPRDVRSSLPILLAEIELAKADRESDPDKALPYISESISRLQKFIQDEGSHPRVYEAHINVGYLKLRKAKTLVDRMEAAKSAEEHDRMKQQAVSLYREVTEDFEKLAQDWKRIQPSTPEIEGAIMDARLEANRSRYEHAKVPGLEPAEKKKLLEDAAKNLEDFEIDYGDTAKAFEAMLLEGRCLFELGEYAKAETKFKNTITLLDVLSKNKIPRNPYFDQIIYGAYISMAQLYLKTNRPRECRLFVEGTFKSDPVSERDWSGHALKVELVEALFKLKEGTRARGLADEVIAADPNGPFAAKMRERLGQFSRASGGRVEPDRAIISAEGMMAKGRIREALITLRQAVESCTTDEQKAKLAPRALYLMAQCLQDLRRNYEAAIVYEKIVGQFPAHEVAVKACWEAVVCYSNEFDSFKDPQDGKEKDRLMQVLLDKFPGASEADNIPYLQGLNLENARKLKEAAEKYLKVPERAPAFESSLVRGAYCLRFDAFRQYAENQKKKVNDPAADKVLIDQLARAEGYFKQFMDRVESGKFPTKSPEEARVRATLVVVVNQELAYIYNHKLVGKAKEALDFLNKVAKDIPHDDSRMARIHLLQIQSQLVLNQSDEAVKTLELMFDRFPDEEVTAQACKSVGIRLDEITTEIIKKLPPGAALPDVAKENLKKINKYYDKWLKGAMSYSMNVTVADVMSVAETLYHNAKRLNSLPDEVQSFMDLKKGLMVGWKNYFEEAEFVHSLLTSGQFRDRVPPKELPTLMIRRARCLSFIADQSDSWLRAKTAYETLIRHFGVEDAKGNFVAKVVIEKPVLLGPYIELGMVYFELGRLNKIHYDNAITTFSNVASVSAPASEPWWIARFMIAFAHYRRGKDRDIMTAQTMIKMLRDNYPNFDDNKYGMKDRFEELEKQMKSGGH